MCFITDMHEIFIKRLLIRGGDLCWLCGDRAPPGSKIALDLAFMVFKTATEQSVQQDNPAKPFQEDT